MNGLTSNKHLQLQKGRTLERIGKSRSLIWKGCQKMKEITQILYKTIRSVLGFSVGERGKGLEHSFVQQEWRWENVSCEN
jgi:hypothetical protein